jgi:hypothetical protein
MAVAPFTAVWGLRPAAAGVPLSWTVFAVAGLMLQLLPIGLAITCMRFDAVDTARLLQGVCLEGG